MRRRSRAGGEPVKTRRRKTAARKSGNGPKATNLARITKTKQLVHVADMTAEQAYIEGDPLFVNAVEIGGYRTVLHVPMLKEEQLVGLPRVVVEHQQLSDVGECNPHL
jgi:hypothetical protein